MVRKAWEEGQKNGKITIIKRTGRDENGYMHYTVQCECGETFDTIVQDLGRSAKHGCRKCRAKERARRKVEPYVGKTYGALEIIGYDDSRGSYYTCVLCRCKKCGNITSGRLGSVIRYTRQGCQKCGMTGLAKGTERVKENSVCGTRIDLLRFGKKVNKNSTTGINGVALDHGRYRAYINFQRKQYHLGTFNTIEEAAKARKTAEQKIYGDFLGWYQEHKEEVKKNKAENKQTEYDPKIVK